jgi:hypothetical protein
MIAIRPHRRAFLRQGPRWRELLEFHNAVSDRILEVYGTIQKPIRTAAKTWEAVCR